MSQNSGGGTDRPEDVVVLFGGDGSEHRVSVASAQNVASFLDEARLWFATRSGGVIHIPREALFALSRPFESDLEPTPIDSWPDLTSAVESRQDRSPLTFFVALHGGTGEDGTLQSFFEARRLAFTGSGSRASRLAFDKRDAREIVRREGIRVAEAIVVDRNPATHEALARLAETHGRIVIKPLRDGSSHGVRIVTNERELNDAIVAVRADSRPHLAEAFVRGRELTVGTLQTDEGILPLPCSEVRLEAGRQFDFEGKYLGRGSLEITPAEISEAEASAVQQVALTAHRALGCEGYARTDVILSESGPVFLETNTLPGLTRASFIPQQLEAAGIPMADFLEGQLRLARRRRDAAAGKG